MVELVDTHDLPAACLTAVRAGRLKIVMYYVYAIKSLKKKYVYIGISDDPNRRISQHNKGYNRTTKPYTPFGVIVIEKFDSREAARKREKFLKSGIGREYLKKLD